jgi:hypothetical protein
MGDDPYNPTYEYVAYIDEAGDPGLRNLRPDCPTGSSEWFILSAVVVAKKFEMPVRDWVADMIRATGRTQRTDLHFRALHEAHKALVCTMLASQNVRCFSICSHKKSLLDWPHSPALRAMQNQDWFYSFLSRYLLERVTYFVSEHSKKTTGDIKRVKIIFSERGGLNVGQMTAYYDKLRHQTRSGRMVLKRGNIVWEAFHPLLLKRANPKVSSGLQLADIVASSFFTACDQYNTLNCDPQYALLLRDRVARCPDKRGGLISGYGVKILPEFEPEKLLPIQSEVFRKYGYPKEWWAPVPTTPPYFK